MHGNVKALLQHLPGLAAKRTDYIYDLISGKVNYAFYQYGQADQLLHRYGYDGDNRLTDVYTSTDGYIWDADGAYFYYGHGPLSRTELGQYKVQGMDYHYTLQGWLKGVNLPGAGDIGADGTATKRTGKDAFAFSLGYYQGDYTPISTTAINQGERDRLWTRYQEQTNTSGLYNGNIAWMVTDLTGGTTATPPTAAAGPQGMLYGYDQLNRIRWARSLTNYNASSGFAPRAAGAQAYDSRYSYDANGNLLTQLRHDGAAAVQDDFNYQYYAGTNRLMSVRPDSEVYEDKVFSSGAVPASNKPYANISLQNQAYVATGTNVKLQATQKVTIKSAFSIQGGGSLEIDKAEGGTYKYDALGNLIRDEQEGTSISWNAYGKIKQVDKQDGSRLTFSYDAAGNRIAKTVTKAGRTTTTHYLRDASGNVMSIYQDALLEEQPLYGSSRLGSYKGGRLVGERRLGLKHYELSNHLDNVLAVISDNITLSATETLAKTLSTTDYHPFGLQMEGRTFNFEKVRYGFQKQEKDDEISGEGKHIDFKFRGYDPRIGRFWSVDPLAPKFVWNSPYAFAANSPIAFMELEGAETYDPTANLWNSAGMNTVEARKIEEKTVDNMQQAGKVGTKVLVVGAVVAIDIFITKGWLSRTLLAYEMGNAIDNGEQAYKARKYGNLEEAEKYSEASKHSYINAGIGLGSGIVARHIVSSLKKTLPAKELDKIDLGEGRVFNHFTDADALAGITGLEKATIENLKVGEGMVVNRLSFSSGQNQFMAGKAGDIFVTELPANSSSGQLI